MKRRRAKRRASDALANMHAAGFRDGVRGEREGIANRLRLCGLVGLASALENDDGFLFAFEAFCLRDHAAARRDARERASDRPRPTVERQLSLFTGRSPLRRDPSSDRRGR